MTAPTKTLLDYADRVTEGEYAPATAKRDMADALAEVDHVVEVKISADQRNALASVVHDLGIDALIGSALLYGVNNPDEVDDVSVGHLFLAMGGNPARRHAEKRIYLKGDYRTCGDEATPPPA